MDRVKWEAHRGQGASDWDITEGNRVVAHVSLVMESDLKIISSAKDLLMAAKAVVEWADEQKIGIPVRTRIKDVIAEAEVK